MPEKMLLTATFPDGRAVTHTTERAYTHVVMITDPVHTIFAWTSDPIKTLKRETVRVARLNHGSVAMQVVAINSTHPSAHLSK